MPKPTTVRISVIIPCYNEEATIAGCLEALASQTVRPYEVIVVDNNSTDKTAQIAKTHGALVVKETKQGLIAARNKGLNAAHGNILARVDADTIVSETWIEEIETMFEDDAIMAITGTGYFYDFPLRELSKNIRNFFAVNFGKLLLGHDMLWGSNMALRAKAWQTVRLQLCTRDNIMEDLDIAMHMADEFGPVSIKYHPAMRADISVRRGTNGVVQNHFYITMWPNTLRGHRRTWALAWPAAYLLTVSAGPFMNTVARFYNGETNRWTLNKDQLLRKDRFNRDNP